MATIVDQINVRIDPAKKVRVDAAAAALGQTSSELVREVIDGSLDALEERAAEAVRKAHQWQGAIPPAAVEQELLQLTRAIPREQPLTVAPADLLSARGKAMALLLQWIWGDVEEMSPAEKSAHTKLLGWFESLKLPKPGTTPAAEPVDAAKAAGVESRPIKPYPRRKS